MRSLLESPQLGRELEQAFAWTRAEGFRLYYPYFDRRVAELALRIRAADLLDGATPKAPLRRLVERLVPLELPARKVDFTPLADRLLRRCGPAWWEKTGRGECLASLGLIDAAAAGRTLRDYFEGRGSWLTPWLLLSTELWLRGRL